MVSPRVMMTNNHVLGGAAEAGTATVEFDFFEREDGTTGPVSQFHLRPDELFVTDAPLDFTLVAVESTNPAGEDVSSRGWYSLVGPSGKAVVGERLSVIQHPNGDPQKVAVHDNKLAVVEPANDFLPYTTDTQGGSSGSPVLNIHWDLVALHHAATAGGNEGIRVSSIVRRLREIFREESAGPRSVADPSMVEELLAAAPPPPPANGGGESNGRAGEHGLGGRGRSAAPSGPTVNPDGTTCWIVPISVTLGVGQQPSLGGVGGRLDPAVATPGPRPMHPGEDPLLREAIEALEATEGRVYYSKTEDQKAVKDYYPSFSGLSKAKAYDTLSELLRETHTTTLSYKRARLQHLYPWIDRREDPGRKLRGIYSNEVFDALEVIRQEVAMERRREAALRERIERESLESADEAFLEELEAQNPFNCEHVVPQSWFNKRKQPKTDLHHLFTCESKCNSFRSNRAYFDFEAEAAREGCGESQKGKFEPKVGKGAAARATLYFLLRYPGDIADAGKEMPKGRLKTIIDWAKEDKIDRWEFHRNAEIHKVQGNRNPLIDFPEMVDKIDFTRGWASGD